jgi:hypothetical protein
MLLISRFSTGLYHFLAQEEISLSLLAVWAVSNSWVLLDTMNSIDYLPKEDIEAIEAYLIGHTMAIIPFVLLLPRVEKPAIGERRSTVEING